MVYVPAPVSRESLELLRENFPQVFFLLGWTAGPDGPANGRLGPIVDIRPAIKKSDEIRGLRSARSARARVNKVQGGGERNR